MAGLRETLRHHLNPHRHSALLIAIVVAFLIRPVIGNTGAGPVVFSFATNTSASPPGLVSNAPDVVGKSVDWVYPVM